MTVKKFKLKKRDKTKWIKALRSGEYKQGRSKLKERTGSITRYCCLGVACAVGIATPHRDRLLCSKSFMPLDIQEKLALKNDGEDVYIFNGSREIKNRWSFNRIAKWIEENL